MPVNPEDGMEVLSPNECWALMRTAEVGRLAVVVDTRPEIFPVNFVVDHGSVVFRTAEGTKLLAVAHGAPVAFEVDGFDAEAGDAWSVVLAAHAQAVTGIGDLVDTVGLPLFPWHASPKPTFVRITPDTVSGRRFRVVEHAAWQSPVSGAPTAENE